jgi:hypothetical protein
MTRVYVPLDMNMTPTEIVAALKEAATVARADGDELKAVEGADRSNEDASAGESDE